MRLRFTKHAQRDLAALEASQRTKIVQALEKLQTNPEPAELRKKMRPGLWRLRVGDWRLILEVDFAAHLI